MAQVLVRRLEEGVVQRLKTNARRAGRSLEEECRMLLERGARPERELGTMAGSVHGDPMAPTDVRWEAMDD